MVSRRGLVDRLTRRISRGLKVGYGERYSEEYPHVRPPRVSPGSGWAGLDPAVRRAAARAVKRHVDHHAIRGRTVKIGRYSVGEHGHPVVVLEVDGKRETLVYSPMARTFIDPSLARMYR